MFGFGTQELLIILIIALFLFGGKKLPEIGAGLGKGLRSFKKGLKEMDEEIESGTSEAKLEERPAGSTASAKTAEEGTAAQAAAGKGATQKTA